MMLDKLEHKSLIIMLEKVTDKLTKNIECEFCHAQIEVKIFFLKQALDWPDYNKQHI